MANKGTYTPALIGSGQFGKCAHCGLLPTAEGHDGCLGTLSDPDIMNACCGHGDNEQSYIQYWDGVIIRGQQSCIVQARLKGLTLMKTFKSIEQAKSQAMFFKKGHVIPTRIIKVLKRKDQHRIKFGADMWVLTGKRGYVCFSHQTNNTYAIKVVGISRLNAKAAPYFDKGYSNFQGNLGLTDAEWLFEINRVLEI